MGSAASRDAKTITLVSSDGEQFEVPEAAASLSQVIRRSAIDNDKGSPTAAGADLGCQLSRIPGKVLAMVLEYCNKHAAMSSSANSKEELRSYDEKFIEVDQFTLYDLLVAAYYLEIQELLDLACQVYDRLEEKTRVESRKAFRVKDDYFVPALDEEEEEEEDEEQWLLV
ncbi:unnamed protein product [Urochloa humidicola]